MFSTVLLWTMTGLCLVIGVVFLFRRPYTSSILLFIAALFSLSCLTFIDLQTLQYPEKLFAWRKYGLLFEAATVFCCYYYTKTAFRDNSQIYKGTGFWISILVAFCSLIYVIAIADRDPPLFTRLF